MFFYLSKILYFLVQPINWVAMLLVLSFFIKNKKRKQYVLGLCIALFFFLNNHFIFNQVMCWWEINPISIATLPTYDIGILAGGYSTFFIKNTNDRHNFSARANRFTQAVSLFFEGKIKKILLTGGSGYIFGDQPSEALEIKKHLLLMGVPDSCIILEAASRTTYENALYTKRILAKDYPKASCLLITSAWHMPRTSACFKKQNIKFTPFPVDHIGERTRFVPESLLIPDRKGFYHWEILTKEWVGYLMYYLRGYL